MSFNVIIYATIDTSIKPTIKQAKIDYTTKPNPTKIFCNTLFFVFIIANPEKLIKQDKKPPIAPPTTGNISHKTTLFPHIITKIGAHSAKIISPYTLCFVMVLIPSLLNNYLIYFTQDSSNCVLDSFSSAGYPI